MLAILSPLLIRYTQNIYYKCTFVASYSALIGYLRFHSEIIIIIIIIIIHVLIKV